LYNELASSALGMITIIAVNLETLFFSTLVKPGSTLSSLSMVKLVSFCLAEVNLLKKARALLQLYVLPKT
jgi:hypothetical protein